MLQEHHFVPYSVSELPEGPWLVFVPHPDDETFGMGGSLLLARSQSIEVHLVIVTDGAQGGSDSEQLVGIRQREVRQVGEKLGVKSLIFLDLPDRHIEITPQLLERLTAHIEAVGAHSVFFPTPMEFHPDHRMTAFMAWRALRQLPLFSGHAYAYEISVQSPVNCMIDITPVREEKRQLMRIYTSQLGENNYIDVVEGLDKARTFSLSPKVQAAEAYYKFEAVDSMLQEKIIRQLKPYWLGEEVSEEVLMSKLSGLEKELDMANEKLQAVMDSTSWRVTRPLRGISSLMRNLLVQPFRNLRQ